MSKKVEVCYMYDQDANLICENHALKYDLNKTRVGSGIW